MADVKVDVKNEVTGEEQIARFGSELKNMLVGAAGGALTLGAVATAARAAYDSIGRGAALIDARNDFNDLAVAIGTTADVMSRGLSEATKGLMTDAEQMSAATSLMQLNLGLTSDEVTRLVGISADLGWQMGDLAQALNTGSARSLAALGLGIDDVQARIKALEAAGYDTNEAFRLALVDAATDKIAIVGSVADETAGKLQTMQAAIANARDTFDQTFSQGVAEQLAGMAASGEDLAKGITAAADAAARIASSLATPFLQTLVAMGQTQQINDLKQQLEELGLSAQEIQNIGAGVTQPVGRVTNAEDAVERQRQLIDLYTQAISRAGAANHFFSMTSAQQAAVLLGLSDTTLTAADRVEYLVAAEGMVVESNAAVASSSGTAAGALDTLSEAEQRAAVAAAQLALMQALVVATYGDYAEGADKAYRAANRHATTDAERIEQMKARAAAMTESMNQQLQAVSSFGGGFSAVADDAEQAMNRMRSAFSSEVGMDAAAGLIGADGLVNLEEMNNALFDQADAAGASATQLALLGIATGKFTQEQAQAALKAAILQEQLRKIASGVVSGQITIEQAMAGAGQLQAQLDTTTSMEQLQSLVDTIGGTEATVGVGFNALTADTDDYIAYLRGLSVDVGVNFGRSGPPEGEAEGGPVTGGVPYMVGEVGPELFVPTTNGMIVPNWQLQDRSTDKSSGGYTLVFNFNGPVTGRDEVKAAAEDAAGRLMEQYLLVGGKA